ncbi:MAG: helix-turn-helix domain-containing protein [Acidobacteriota bacterium]
MTTSPPFGGASRREGRGVAARRAARELAEAEVIEVDGLPLDPGRCEARRELKSHRAHVSRGGDPALAPSPQEARRHPAPSAPRGVGVSAAMTVDVTIANLRHKIEQDSSRPRIVVSVKGVGYAWGEERA